MICDRVLLSSSSISSQSSSEVSFAWPVIWIILCLGCPAFFNLATTAFLVEWFEIFFPSMLIVCARVFIMLPSLCSPILDLAYQTSVFGRCIIAKYKGPEVRISNGRLLRNSSKSRTGSLGPPSVAHISWGVFLCFAERPPERVFVGFSFKRTHFANSPQTNFWS